MIASISLSLSFINCKLGNLANERAIYLADHSGLPGFVYGLGMCWWGDAAAQRLYEGWNAVLIVGNDILSLYTIEEGILDFDYEIL